jgi:hypothetical protein
MLERNPPISDRLYVSNTSMKKFHLGQAVLDLQAVAALTISKNTGQHEHHFCHGKVDANAVSSAFAKRKLIPFVKLNIGSVDTSDYGNTYRSIPGFPSQRSGSNRA